MSNRKSYFENFPTDTLFLVLEQNIRELSEIETGSFKVTNELKNRIKQLELTVTISKNKIIERFLQDNISLTQIAKLLISSTGIRKSVYKEIFTLMVLRKDEMISLDLLEMSINELDMSQLMLIMVGKDNKLYRELATKKYDEIIFDVEPDVYEELILKKKMDRRR